MSDRELLELAAMTIGRVCIFERADEEFDHNKHKAWLDTGFGALAAPWDPLGNDDDARSLANLAGVEYHISKDSGSAGIDDSVRKRREVVLAVAGKWKAKP